jgi:hypothetical protein
MICPKSAPIRACRSTPCTAGRPEHEISGLVLLLSPPSFPAPKKERDRSRNTRIESEWSGCPVTLSLPGLVSTGPQYVPFQFNLLQAVPDYSGGDCNTSSILFLRFSSCFDLKALRVSSKVSTTSLMAPRNCFSCGHSRYGQKSKLSRQMHSACSCSRRWWFSICRRNVSAWARSASYRSMCVLHACLWATCCVSPEMTLCPGVMSHFLNPVYRFRENSGT